MMVEIIKVFRSTSCQWLMLECGHWLKWSGKPAMRAGQEMRCPSCDLPALQPTPKP